MNRTRGGGMRGFTRKSSNTSVKDRIGFASRRGGNNNAGRPQLRKSAAQLIQQQLGNGTERRSVRGRLGGNVGLGRVLDARQKINLNRVQHGRISDAREKLDAKRKQQGVISGKIKNLKITTTVAPLRGGYYTSAGRGGTSHSAGYFASDPPVFGAQPPPPMNSGTGVFRSAMGELFQAPQPRMTGMANPGHQMYAQNSAPSRSLSPGMFLTRTINNPTASSNSGGMGYSNFDQRPTSSGVAKVAPNPQYRGYARRTNTHPQAMEEDEPISHPRHLSSSMQARLDASNSEVRYKIQVSNLQSSVTSDDIVELFSDIGQLVSAKMTSQGHAEVTYAKKSDALKAVEAYHNRLLDGSPMRVFMEPTNSTTTLKSAAGSSIKLPKASSGIKIQPDISAIHKVLFNPSSSGTRGLFKAGQ